jgi:GNAT superfamily N-acetyltransferase
MSPPNLNNPQEELDWRTQVYAMAAGLPNARVFKAIDSGQGERIVGAAGYFGPGGMQWIMGEQMTDSGEVQLPSNFDLQKKKIVEDILKGKRNEILKGDYNVWGKRWIPQSFNLSNDAVELSQIFVEPEYQGKGIGKLMLEEGLRLAEADKLPLYLEGTPCGKRLYEKLGFDLISETDFPGVVADEINYKTSFMIKYPEETHYHVRWMSIDSMGDM